MIIDELTQDELCLSVQVLVFKLSDIDRVQELLDCHGVVPIVNHMHPLFEYNSYDQLLK